MAPKMEPSWPSWAPSRPSYRHLGAILAPMFAPVGFFERILGHLGCILASSWAPLFGRGPPRCPGCRQDPPNQPSRHRFSMILGPISLPFGYFFILSLCACFLFLDAFLFVCLFVCSFVCLLACLFVCVWFVGFVVSL